jgi:hypothetical protein
VASLAVANNHLLNMTLALYLLQILFWTAVLSVALAALHSPHYWLGRPLSLWMCFTAALLITSCVTTPAQNSAIAATAGTIAQSAASAVAAAYGGPLAGAATNAVLGAVQPTIDQQTANGLDAIAVYVQGQVGSKASPAIVAASAGVPGVGAAVAPLVSPTATVTQGDADLLFQAATLALKKK